MWGPAAPTGPSPPTCGAWRRQTDETTGEVVSDHLRTGATWSGIALRFGDGTPDGLPVTLVKLFHLRAGENTNPTELHVMLSGSLDLLDMQPYARDGLQTRAIKAAWPDAIVTDRHSVFAARFCRALGIGGDNALQLLHRTQSAKNLGSLDDLFRGFMLDEPTTFGHAETAVEQFTELASAHAHVVTARRQIARLAPLRALAGAYDEAQDEARARGALLESLPAFTDAWLLELARAERNALAGAEEQVRHRWENARRAVEVAEQEARSAQLVVLQSGGQALALHRASLEQAQAALEAARRRREQVGGRLAEVGVAAPTTFAEFTELRGTAQREREDHDRARAEHRLQLHALYSAATDARQALDGIDRELVALRRARSNLDASLLEARTIVSRATGLAPDLLPFVGELVQVRPEHAAEWQGPIERVLRPLATVMLVPAVHRETVLRAVNSHHLRSRLVLEIVPARAGTPRLVGDPGSLVHRVQVKDGSSRAWVEETLSRQYDYPCVADESDLAGLDRGVTRAGLVKRGSGRHEKDDRFAVDDRGRWVLGFDNADKLDLLLERRRAAASALEQAEKRIEAASDVADRGRDRLGAARPRRRRVVRARCRAGHGRRGACQDRVRRAARRQRRPAGRAGARGHGRGRRR